MGGTRLFPNVTILDPGVKLAECSCSIKVVHIVVIVYGTVLMFPSTSALHLLVVPIILLSQLIPFSQLILSTQFFLLVLDAVFAAGELTYTDCLQIAEHKISMILG